MLTLVTFFTMMAFTFVRRSEERNYYREVNDVVRKNLSLYSRTTDVSLELLSGTLMNLPLSSEGSVSLSMAEGGMELSLDEKSKAVNRIQNNIKSIRINYPYLEGVAIYYPHLQLFLNERVNPEITQELYNRVQELHSSSLGWQYMETSQGVYCYRDWKIGNCYICGWFLLSRFLEHLGISDFLNESYVSGLWITDAGGRVQFGSGSLQGERIISAGQQLQLDASHQEVDKKNALIIEPLGGIDGYLACQVVHSLLQPAGDRAGSSNYLLVVFIIDILVIVIVFLGIVIWVNWPLQYFLREINKMKKDSSHRIRPARHFSDEFEQLFSEFNDMLDQIEKTKILIYEQQLEQQATKLRHLGQQIQPHFMLNALNTIYNYVRRDPDTARNIIQQLSVYYRYVVNVESNYVPLQKELDHIENYLKFQKIRLGERLHYVVACPEELKVVPIPPFLIESFVGNCLKYGVNKSDEINLSIRVDQVGYFKVRLRISDDGAGFPEETLQAVRQYLQRGEVTEFLGVGIRNSIERIRLIYQDRANVNIYNNHGAVVELMICLQKTAEV